MHWEGDVPNVHLNVLETKTSLCIWRCGAYLLMVWGMDLNGLTTARLFQFSSPSELNLPNQI